MLLFGIAGRSGAGKTTLITRLLPLFRQQGLSVSTIKEGRPGLDLDRPGKDSHRHREAGAAEVMLVSGGRTFLMADHGAAPPPLAALAARLRPVDLVLVEGFRAQPMPRLEVWRAVVDRPPLAREDRSIGLMVSDGPVAGWHGPWLALDDVPGIARTIIGFLAPEAPRPWEP